MVSLYLVVWGGSWFCFWFGPFCLLLRLVLISWYLVVAEAILWLVVGGFFVALVSVFDVGWCPWV